MTGEHNHSGKLPENTSAKPVEKSGYPPLPPKAAMDDLRFIVKESIKLGGRLVTELDRLLSALRK